MDPLFDLLLKVLTQIGGVLWKKWQSDSTSRSPRILPPRPLVFVNRDEELRQLSKLLNSPIWPLRLAPSVGRAVLIWGMAGVGKTDLALEAAYRLQRSFKDGTVFLMASHLPAEELLSMIAASLDIKVGELPLRQKKIVVQNALVNKNCLFVFDNVQQSDPIFEIMDVVGTCGLIVTSRSLLPLSGAHQIKLDELPYENAVELFRRIVKRDLGEKEGKLVEEICKRLDRLPLAVVLASKQVQVTQVELGRLLQRISQTPLDVLQPLNLENQGQSLRAVFESTYQTLSPSDQAAFSMLGVFSEQGFSLEAALAINPDSKTEERISHLVALSLIKPLGNSRFQLHPLVRIFAQEKLQDEATYQRMVQYYMQYVRQQQGTLKPLELERPNILIAIDWSKRNQEWAQVITLAEALLTSDAYKAYVDFTEQHRTEFVSDINKSKILTAIDWAHQTERWLVVVALTEALFGSDAYYASVAQQGYWNESIERACQALEAAVKLQDKEAEARFSADLGLFCYWQGKNDEARDYYHTSLNSFESMGDKRGEILILHRLGYIEDDEDNYAQARKLYERSLQLAVELGESELVSLSRHLVGVVAYHEGNYDDARRLISESLKEELARSDNAAVSRTQRRLAAVARMQGHYAPLSEKKHYFEEAHRLLDDCLKNETNLRSRARALRQLGMVMQEEGKLDEAFRKYNDSLDLFTRLGNTKGIAAVKYNLASVFYEKGKNDEAEDLCMTSLQIARELKCRYGEALALRQLAWIARRKRNMESAVNSFRQAIAILQIIRSGYVDEFQIQLNQLEAVS